MTERELDELMVDEPSWTAPMNAEAKKGFVYCMRRYQYGHSAMTSAWEWFLSGYHTPDE